MTPFCDAFAPASVQGNPKARQAWAVEEMKIAAKASQRLGLKLAQTFSGSLAWPYVYPWPQRPGHLIEAAFGELGQALDADPRRLRRSRRRHRV